MQEARAMKETIDVNRATGAAGLTREELLRRAAVGGGTLLLGGRLAQVAQVAQAASDAAPKRGGTFRLGVSGGSAKDIIDGEHIITRPDQARISSGWEGLVRFNAKYKVVQDSLAKEISAKRADVWTIRLRKG